MIPFHLLSPTTGRRLEADTPHSLKDGTGARWPVIDGIPYLRVSRGELIDRVLAALDRGREEEALVALLPDQDDWWQGERPTPEWLRHLVRNRETISLREALDDLAFGPVADYFLNRWSDPTFLAGLALLEAHWNAPRCVFELACGIGHYLRELQLRGYVVSGGDVVFAKLWLARRWVVPAADLVCFDAAAPWPVPDGSADLVTCHDALYFLPAKPHVAAEMRRVAGPAGTILVSHAHNRLVENLSAGEPLAPAEYAALFGGTVALYDDAELTRALAEVRVPTTVSADALEGAAAVALAVTERAAVRVAGGLALPSPGARLVRNPLYVDEAGTGTARLRWPSPRYEAEYGALATYPAETDAPSIAAAGAGPAVDGMARRRILLDLPARW